MLLKSIVGGKSSSNMNHAKMIDGYYPIFSQNGKNIYASDIVQMCIDVVATECSKLQPKHIRIDGSGVQSHVNSSINRLFKCAPNELMTTRDFIEKTIWLLYMNYNAFIYPTYIQYTDKNSGRTVTQYTGFYPLNPTQVDFLQDGSGKLFVKFYFDSGKNFTLPYAEVIHLRKKFSVNNIMGGGANGQPDNQALLKVLDINNTVLQGVGKAIKSSMLIRGIIKINTMLDDDKQRAEREKFEKTLASGEAGILPMDLKGEYTPLKLDPKVIDKDTMEFLQNKVLYWYGVSQPILSGNFTDEQYQAFYEKTLEPLIISLGQAFTKCLFTNREVSVGNEIAFFPQKLLFTNTKNKAAIADILGNRGALTNNQLLELFGYPPYPGGDVRVQSLNYVDVLIASKYQLNKLGGMKE